MTQQPFITPPTAPPRAFTLIELLVVVSLIVLLVALLLPALGAARETGRGIACASFIAQIGTAAHDFAEDNDRRGPGDAHRFTPTSSSISWVNILNDEYFRRTDGGPIQRMGPEKTGDIYCPSMRPYVTPYSRAYNWNINAAGGARNNSDPTDAGAYGKLITPPTDRHASYDFYRLGARLTAFANPSDKFLLVENERADDYANSVWPAAGVPILGDDPTYPPWSGNGGNFAFRHIGESANFLCVDMHVERKASTDSDINLSSRFSFQ